MEACSTGRTESLRLMALNSYNWLMSLAGSGFKTEEEHLNIQTVDSSVCYNASTLLICGNMRLNTNILMHPKGGLYQDSSVSHFLCWDTCRQQSM